MNKYLIAATAIGAMTWTALVSAEPVKMTDTQMNAVTAGGGFIVVKNVAIATNIISASGGSATAKCFAGCAAVNVPIASGNIVAGWISQVAVAKAGNH